MGLFGRLLRVAGGLAYGIAGVLKGDPKMAITGGYIALKAILPEGGEQDLAARQRGTLVTMTADPQAWIPVVYGATRVGLRIIDIRQPSATPNILYLVGAFCHGSRDGLGIQSIGNIYFDDRTAWNANDTVAGTFSGKLVVAKFLGSATQDVRNTTIDGSTLDAVFGTEWTSTDTGKGFAGIIAKLTYDAAVYPSGIPNITADIKGALVEDPRSQVSGVNITFSTPSTIERASGSWNTDGYDVDDRIVVTGSASNDGTYTVATIAPTTMTVDESFSAEGPVGGVTVARWALPDNGGDNPWLCARDHLMSGIYGAGIVAADIDDAGAEAEADYCDATVSIPGPATQARYTCNGWLDCAQPITQRLAAILSSCRGNIVYQGGTFRFFITQSKAASGVALTEDDIVEGSWRFSTAGARDKINVIRGRYVDPDQNYQVDTVQWPEPGAANTFLTNDNSFENRREFDLSMTDDRYRAAQIIQTMIKESRSAVTVEVTARESALELEVGDICTVTADTPNWSAKSFWVMAVQVRQEAVVDLVLREYTSADYTLDSLSTKAPATTTELPNPDSVNAPTGLTLTATAAVALNPDGNYTPRIKVQWTASTSAFIDHYEVEVKETGQVSDAATDTDFDRWGNPATAFPSSADAGFYVSPVEDGISYTVRVRAVNTMGRASSWVSAAATPAAAPTTITDEIDGFSATQDTAAAPGGLGPENGDVVLSADNDDAFSNLEGANTTATVYYVYFDVDATGMDGANTVTVYLATNTSATDTTGWVTRAQRNYDNTANLTDEVLSTGSVALGAGYDLRLLIVYDSAPGAAVAFVTAHGEDNSVPGVQFKKYA